MTELISCYVDFVSAIVPFALVYGIGNLAVSTILRAAFGGRLYAK